MLVGRSYWELARMWSGSDSADYLDAVSRHLAEGVEHAVDGWVRSGELPCGVDGCHTSMLDPAAVWWLLVFTPGLDVVPICSDHRESAGRFNDGTVFYVLAPDDVDGGTK